MIAGMSSIFLSACDILYKNDDKDELMLGPFSLMLYGDSDSFIGSAQYIFKKLFNAFNFSVRFWHEQPNRLFYKADLVQTEFEMNAKDE